MRNLALKPIFQGIYKGSIDSGLSSKSNGTKADALTTLFDSSRASEGVSELKKQAKIVQKLEIWLKVNTL